MAGVDKVAVSLTHEQALVEYDPQVARPDELLETLRDIGYTVSDPRKVRPYEEEERDLVREGRRFVAAVVLSVASIALIAKPTEHWFSALPALVCLSLGVLVFLVLRPSGLWKASAGFGGLAATALTLLGLNLRGDLTSISPWAVGALALILVFGIGHHILHMAVQALRRGVRGPEILVAPFPEILVGPRGL
jgi:cation transport ATPase